MLDDGKAVGGSIAWKPEEIGGRKGGSEVYRREEIELRAGDRVRWTRNDAGLGLGLVNSRTADVLAVKDDRVTFRLEDGKTLELGNRNGSITCAAARRHGIAPVRRSHPAYRYMRDGDGDGVVCE